MERLPVAVLSKRRMEEELHCGCVSRCCVEEEDGGKDESWDEQIVWPASVLPGREVFGRKERSYIPLLEGKVRRPATAGKNGLCNVRGRTERWIGRQSSRMDLRSCRLEEMESDGS